MKEVKEGPRSGIEELIYQIVEQWYLDWVMSDEREEYADEAKWIENTVRDSIIYGFNSRDAEVAQLRDKLKDAVKVFETCSNAMSYQVSIRDENRLGWAFKEVVEFLEKLKAE